MAPILFEQNIGISTYKKIYINTQHILVLLTFTQEKIAGMDPTFIEMEKEQATSNELFRIRFTSSYLMTHYEIAMK